MNQNDKIKIICFLTTIKENKKLYKSHKGEIDHYIELLKDDISEKSPSLSKISIKNLIIWLSDIAFKHFNSS